MAFDTATSGGAWHLRRRGWPLVTLALWAVVILTLQMAPVDGLDRGMRSTFSFLSGVIAALLIGIWFFGLAGISRRTRAIVGAVLAVLAIATVASIRQVEFSGDMEPTFDFRWQQSREARLEQFLDSETAAPLEVVEEGPGLVRPRPEDSPRYRGINVDGKVIGPRLARNWEAQPPKCLWRHPCGGGYASFSVIGDVAVTIEQRGENEVIVCYHVPTGRTMWTYEYRARFSETLGGDGPRATPTIHQGRIYSLGATGELVKLDLAAHYKIWQTNILVDNPSVNLEWGMSGSPLIDGDRVIVNPGAQKGTDQSADLLAYDIESGKIVLRAGHATASYSSPIRATLAGRDQILIFDAGGLAGFDPADGAELWRVPWKSDFDINAAQPIVLNDDEVVITSQAGCARIMIVPAGDQFTPTEVWRNRAMKCSYANPIAHNGFLYGLDEGIMACVDLATGKRMWKGGRYGHGQMLLADDLLVVLSEKGELVLVEATSDELRELGKIQAIEGKTWNNPVLVGGRALVRNHLEMACYELPLKNPSEQRDTPTTADDGNVE